MTRRDKGLLIVGAVWVTLAVITAVGFVSSRTTITAGGECNQRGTAPPGRIAPCVHLAPITSQQVFDTGGFVGALFGITLLAALAAVIVVIATRPTTTEGL